MRRLPSSDATRPAAAAVALLAAVLLPVPAVALRVGLPVTVPGPLAPAALVSPAPAPAPGPGVAEGFPGAAASLDTLPLGLPMPEEVLGPEVSASPMAGFSPEVLEPGSNPSPANFLLARRVADMITGMVSELFPGLQKNISKLLARSAARNLTIAGLNFTPGSGSRVATTGRDFFGDGQLESMLRKAPAEVLKAVRRLRAENAALRSQLRAASTTPTTIPTSLLWHGPPPPPHCAPPPHNLTTYDVRMSLAPFKPIGAVGNISATKDGALVWKLADGGWAFQYPKMLARFGGDGRTFMAWAKQKYAVELAPDRIVYHSGDAVLQRDVDGSMVSHQPTGTIHQEGNTLIYHWCQPNLIIYQTPSGIVYYDKDGMTYRGDGAVAHYAPSGDVVYQGTGGITRLFPTGAITHWTKSGAIYHHADGVNLYTPVGESMPQVLSYETLGPVGSDPLPGPPLTIRQVLDLAAQVSGPTMPPAPLPTTTTTTMTSVTVSRCPACAPPTPPPPSSLGPPPKLPQALLNATGGLPIAQELLNATGGLPITPGGPRNTTVGLPGQRMHRTEG